MEDKDVKPGLYAYQFRVDVKNIEDYSTIFAFIKKYDVKHYIIGAEVSDLGKRHFQCILWFTQKIDSSKLRNWWSGRTPDNAQPVALTSAKKIKSLGKYCSKENNFITNLSKEEMQLIGRWDLKVKTKEWNQKLDAHAKKFSENIVVDTFEQVSYDTYAHNPKKKLYAFLAYLLDYYKASGKRPSRATLQYLAWKHGHLNNQLLIQQWF